jgi:opacity protein-like surface antigen
MNKNFIFLFFLFFSFLGEVSAEEGDFSIGGTFGHLGLIGSNTSGVSRNALTYGGFLMYSPSEIFDLNVDFNYSPRDGGNIFYSTIGLRSGYQYDMIKPYLIAGVGVYRSSALDSSTSFGFNVGGGIDIILSSMLTIGLVTRYHPVLSSGSMDDVWDALFRLSFNFNLSDGQSGWN